MIDGARLQDLAAACCRGLGARTEVAGVVAGHLVRADLSGHPSHGIARLPSYADAVEAGVLIPGAEPRIVRSTGATALFDAGSGFGQHSTRVALDWALDAAQRHGVAAAAVRHSQHIGRLGEYAEAAAEAGLVALVSVGMAGDGVGAVVAPGAARRFLGANPFAFGIPAADGRHPVVDVSTAVVAEGKISVAAARGEALPAGWAVDSTGAPTVDPAAYFDGGGLLPLGSPTAPHKGFGLGLVAALLGGLGVIDDDAPSLVGASVAGDADPRGRVAGVTVIAIDPAAFGDRGHYAAATADTIGALRRTAPAAVVPGDPERSARRGSGGRVELPAATADELRALAARLGVDASALDDDNDNGDGDEDGGGDDA